MPRQALFIVGPRADSPTALGRCVVAGGAADAMAAPNALRPLADAVLARAGITWDAPSPAPERVRDLQVGSLIAAAQAKVRECLAEAESVIVDDMAVARGFPFWRQVFEHAGYTVDAVIVAMRPHAFVAAQARDQQAAPEKSLALWLHSLVEAERTTRGLTRIFVTGDAWHADRTGVLERLASDLAFPPAASPAAAAAARALPPSPEIRLQPQAGSLLSGLDTAIDEGYAALNARPAWHDPRSAIEALATRVQPALNAAIPPWIERVLHDDRETIARLAAEVAVRDDRIAALTAELEAARSQQGPDATVLRAELLALREQGIRERSSLLDELTKSRGEMIQLTTALAEAPRATEALRNELAQAHRDLFDERATITRLTDALEAARRDAEGMAQRGESTRHHLEALASELTQTREALQAREHDYAVVADEIDALRVQMADLQTETETALRARDMAQRMLSRTTTERDSARHALEVAAAERAAAEDGIRQSRDALQVLRDELPRRAAAESQLVRERDGAQATLRTVTEKLAAVEAMLAERNAYIGELVQRHNTLAARLNTLDQNVLTRAAARLAKLPRGKPRP
ncbi:MAG: hypothetical protein JSR18_04395 [Proteobacteria bacterium]|nr:hypothetical protein [Pseudomonadota bacterium]